MSPSLPALSSVLFTAHWQSSSSMSNLMNLTRKVPSSALLMLSVPHAYIKC
ncbi:hypothetical protein M404DRAFT_993045, partial [Pisolithus tinctorius Marx 270]